LLPHCLLWLHFQCAYPPQPFLAFLGGSPLLHRVTFDRIALAGFRGRSERTTFHRALVANSKSSPLLQFYRVPSIDRQTFGMLTCQVPGLNPKPGPVHLLPASYRVLLWNPISPPLQDVIVQSFPRLLQSYPPSIQTALL